MMDLRCFYCDEIFCCDVNGPEVRCPHCCRGTPTAPYVVRCPKCNREGKAYPHFRRDRICVNRHCRQKLIVQLTHLFDPTCFCEECNITRERVVQRERKQKQLLEEIVRKQAAELQKAAQEKACPAPPAINISVNIGTQNIRIACEQPSEGAPQSPPTTDRALWLSSVGSAILQAVAKVFGV